MADSNITKRALASALRELMEQTPFEKISVADICESCEMNRKSFYYHFRDKYDLVNWIFDSEFLKAASRQKYSEPWELLGDMCGYFYDNRSFYRRALKIKGQNSFSEHFREMLRPVIVGCLETILTEPEFLEFQISFFSDAFIGAFERWLNDRDCPPPERFVALLRSCIHSPEIDNNGSKH